MIKLLAIICLFVIYVQAAPKWNELADSKYNYYDFIAEYKEPGFLLNTNEAELSKREAIFNENLREVLEHNRSGSSYKMGINLYSDMTDQEFEETVTVINKSEISHNLRDQEITEEMLQVNKDHPKSVNWDSRGFLPGVPRAQKKCGSCYAFAAATAVSSHAFIQTGRNYIFPSQQEMVDCAGADYNGKTNCGGSGGCRGSTSGRAFEYIQDHGVDIEANYPYVSGETKEPGVCRNTTSKKIVSISGHKLLTPNHVDDLMDVISTYGPVTISLAAANIKKYESGIIDKCSTYNATLDREINVLSHAVVLVGYGYDEELNMHYWVARNSWGVDYGEEGNFRFYRAGPDGTEPVSLDIRPSAGYHCKEDDMSPFEVAGCLGALSNSYIPLGVKVHDV